MEGVGEISFSPDDGMLTHSNEGVEVEIEVGCSRSGLTSSDEEEEMLIHCISSPSDEMAIRGGGFTSHSTTTQSSPSELRGEGKGEEEEELKTLTLLLTLLVLLFFLRGASESDEEDFSKKFFDISTWFPFPLRVVSADVSDWEFSSQFYNRKEKNLHVKYYNFYI